MVLRFVHTFQKKKYNTVLLSFCQLKAVSRLEAEYQHTTRKLFTPQRVHKFSQIHSKYRYEFPWLQLKRSEKQMRHLDHECQT